MNSLSKKECLAVMKPQRCQQCGACCRGYAIELQNDDIKREPCLLDYATAWKDIEEAKRCRLAPANFALLLNNAKCPFLNEDSACRIYPTRPKTCRDHISTFLICHVAQLEERGLDCAGAIKEMKVPFNVYAAIMLSINPEMIPPIGKFRGVNPRRVSLVDLVNEEYLKKQLKKALK